MKTLQECNVMRDQLMEKFYQAHPGSKTDFVHNRCVANLPIKFNPRMRSCLGRALFRKWYIELNARVLRQHPEEFDATFAHELAHFVAYVVFKDAGHGLSWKHVMRIFGFPPIRCHNLDLSGIKRRHPVVAIAACACRSEIQIKARRMRKMEQGAFYRCLNCKERLQIVRFVKDYTSDET